MRLLHVSHIRWLERGSNRWAVVAFLLLNLSTGDPQQGIVL